MLKKIFFISTLFLLTHSSNSFASTETQAKQEIESETEKIEDPKFQAIQTNSNKQNTDYLLELYANDKWGFMGRKFIDEWKWTYGRGKAKDSLSSFNTFLIVLTPILIAASSITIHNIYDNHLYHLGGEDDLHLKTIIIELITMIAIGIISNKLVNNRIDRKVIERNYWTIKNFLNNWQKYKNITPKELYPLFEKLIPIFDELESSDNTRIINEIQQQVRDNHSVYYEEYKQSITKPPVIKNYYH